MQLVEAGLRAIGLSEQSLHFSCIPAMHLPPPRTALAREPHATAPVPGPHDAHDAARAKAVHDALWVLKPKTETHG